MVPFPMTSYASDSFTKRKVHDMDHGLSPEDDGKRMKVTPGKGLTPGTGDQRNCLHTHRFWYKSRVDGKTFTVIACT